ncbi:MAG: hypothetical protein GF388_00015 [Candidatus Aegiribacteria sp.]|nr:hypothetical protein [Candidatus Aegiribacteria sp.]MBD3293855.1 hypothetical protein [Candidatus Fermentibacteria bacterium]
MWYVLAALLILIVSGLFGYRGRSSGGGVKEPAVVSRVLESVDLQSLSMEEIDFLLARLEREDPPEPVMGAMCYEAMAYPDVAEYVCPVCGEKTVYSSMNTAFIEWELPGCRRLADSIDSLTDFHVYLDESQFCQVCSDSVIEGPEILLVISADGDDETVNDVSITDLRMLESFLQGNLYYTTFNDGHQPLQEYAPRLRELLGLDGE